MSEKLFGVIPRKTLNEPNKATSRILGDSFLRQLYTDEISLIKNASNVENSMTGLMLEIGAAGGNTKIVWPEVITTDVRESVGVDVVMSAEKICYPDNSVSILFGLDALHHVRDPEQHFDELIRVLKVGGQALYIEPNWNFFSKFCFMFLLKYLHPEPYDIKKPDWILDDPDPMMGNQSQAYNIFVRDADIFNSKYPSLQIEILKPLKGVAFLLSGGVHTRLPVPSRFLIWMYLLENKSEWWMKHFGLGRLISISKKDYK